VIPVFRDIAADETRLFGMLRRVDCRPDAVTLEVDVDGRPRHVRVAAFDQIEFITYRADLQGAVACGSRKTPDSVYVTWRGTDPQTFEIKTPFAVVEFTPLGYVPQ
jgi:hypothetical protein